MSIAPRPPSLLPTRRPWRTFLIALAAIPWTPTTTGSLPLLIRPNLDELFFIYRAVGLTGDRCDPVRAAVAGQDWPGMSPEAHYSASLSAISSVGAFLVQEGGYEFC